MAAHPITIPARRPRQIRWQRIFLVGLAQGAVLLGLLFLAVGLGA